MKKEQAQEYTLTLAKFVAGSWRQIVLAKRLGVPQALGLSLSGWVALLNKEVCAAVDDRRDISEYTGRNGAVNAILAEIANALQSSSDEPAAVPHETQRGEVMR